MKIPTFFDLEIQEWLSQGDLEAGKLRVSCGVVRRNREDLLFRDAPEDVASMIAFLKTSELLVTFNGMHFDNMVLEAYEPGLALNDRVEQFDIMKEIQAVIGHRVSLSHVLKCNVPSHHKSGTGQQALIWWKQIVRHRAAENKAEEEKAWAKLLGYCADDVRALAKLMELIVDGHPLQVQRFWDGSFELESVPLRNPLESSETKVP